MTDDVDLKITLAELAHDLVLDIDIPSEIRGSGLTKVDNYLEAYEKTYKRLCEITDLKGSQ